MLPRQPDPRPRPLSRNVLFAGSLALATLGGTLYATHLATGAACAVPLLLWCASAQWLPAEDPGDPARWGLTAGHPALAVANGLVGVACLGLLLVTLAAAPRHSAAVKPHRTRTAEVIITMFAAETGQYPTARELQSLLGAEQGLSVVAIDGTGLVGAREIARGAAPSATGTVLGPGRPPEGLRAYTPRTYGALIFDRTPRGESYVAYEVGQAAGKDLAVVKQCWQGGQRLPAGSRPAGRPPDGAPIE